MTAIANRFVMLAYGLAGLGGLAHDNVLAAEPLVVEAIVNAPLTTVWQGFATREGYASVGTQAAVDLKVGGLVQVQSDATGTLGDKNTTISEILSYEPERLLSLRVRQPAAGFPGAQSFANTWSIVYFTPLGSEMTHVRIAGFGFNEGAAASGLSNFFAHDQAAQLRKLEKHYWPLCALCKAEGQ